MHTTASCQYALCSVVLVVALPAGPLAFLLFCFLGVLFAFLGLDCPPWRNVIKILGFDCKKTGWPVSISQNDLTWTYQNTNLFFAAGWPTTPG